MQCSDISWVDSQERDTMGLAVVVTLNYDWDGSGMSRLLGTDADQKSWTKALKDLKFDVRVVKNEEATIEKILQMVYVLRKVQLNRECKYLAFVFAGHGSNDFIYLNKAAPLHVEESILSPIIYDENRKEQQKLFFFDCCRDPSLFKFPPLDLKKGQQEGTIRGAVMGSGYFIAYATLKYTKARENAKNGGFFSSTVSEWIVKDKSLNNVFDTVARKMDEKYRQIPERISTLVRSINLCNDAKALRKKGTRGDVSSSDSEDALDKGTHVDTSPKIRQRFKNNNTGNVEHTSHVPKYPYLGTVNQNASTSYPAQNVLPTLPHDPMPEQSIVDRATLVYLISIVLLLVTVVIVILSGYAMTGWLGAMVLVPLFTCIYLVNVSRQG
jgi:hypothetical protein